MLPREFLARVACGGVLVCGASPVAGAARVLAFPQASTYADSVLRCDPSHGGGCVPTNPNFIDPQAALGPVNYAGGANGTGAVALGSGGLLELRLTSQFANSGDARPDLRIIEVGGFDEACFIALRPASSQGALEMVALGLQDANQDGFYEITRISGGTSNIDLDRYFTAPAQAVYFDAVQIVDDAHDHSSCTTTPGADIDAVEALSSFVAIAPDSWTRVKTLYRD